MPARLNREHEECGCGYSQVGLQGAYNSYMRIGKYVLYINYVDKRVGVYL